MHPIKCDDENGAGTWSSCIRVIYISLKSQEELVLDSSMPCPFVAAITREVQKIGPATRSLQKGDGLTLTSAVRANELRHRTPNTTSGTLSFAVVTNDPHCVVR